MRIVVVVRSIYTSNMATSYDDDVSDVTAHSVHWRVNIKEYSVDGACRLLSAHPFI